jgi:hypothetical protein
MVEADLHLHRVQNQPSAPSLIHIQRSPVPTANPKQLTDARESVDSPIDEQSLQIDLVRLDRAVPAAGCVGSRNPRSSTPAQYPAAQIPETTGGGGQN